MTSRQRILALLWDGEPVPSWTLNEKATTADYRSRISELRRHGIEIESIIIDKRHHYRMVTPNHRIDFHQTKLKPEQRQFRYAENLSLGLEML